MSQPSVLTDVKPTPKAKVSAGSDLPLSLILGGDDEGALDAGADLDPTPSPADLLPHTDAAKACHDAAAAGCAAANVDAEARAGTTSAPRHATAAPGPAKPAIASPARAAVPSPAKPVAPAPAKVASPNAAKTMASTSASIPAAAQKVFREDSRTDRRIIEGMLRDRDLFMAQMEREGFPQGAVLRRAAELGLSEALIRQVKGVAADLAGERPGRRSAPASLGARTCLSCDRVFLSSGASNRLCMRCRGGDAGLAQL